MATDQPHIRAALNAFLRAHQDAINVFKWEKASGLGGGTLRHYLKPKKGAKPRTITLSTEEALAVGASKLLGRPVTVDEILGRTISMAGDMDAGATSALEPPVMRTNNDSPSDFLLAYNLTHDASGERGAFVLTSSAALSSIPRVDNYSKKAFTTKLLDNANAPGYKAGHTVVVEAGAGAAIDDFCIFTNEAAIESGAPSIAGHLVDYDAKNWTVTQNNGRKNFQLSRATYPHAWPVVAHYARGFHG